MLSALGIIAAIASQPHCTSLDYKVVRGACENGVRKVVWVKEPRLEVWDCTGEERITQPDETCDCVPQDMVPHYKNAQTISKYSPHVDSKGNPVCHTTASIPSGIPTGDTVSMCTIDDIGFEYTACDPATMKQQIVSYYINHCVPGVTTVTLDTLHEGMPLMISVQAPSVPSNYFIKLMEDASVPIIEYAGPGFGDLNKYIGMEITAIDDQPVTLSDIPNLAKVTGGQRSLSFSVTLPPARTIDCNKQCEAGTYLAPPMSSCGFCPTGTHSIRGDIYTEWTNESWPSNFATRCYATPEVMQWECSDFVMRGTYIDSGDQPPQRSTTVIFNILVDIVTQPAEMRFTMKRDLLDEDTVSLLINGRLEMYWVGGQMEWEESKQEIVIDSCSWKMALFSGNTELGQFCIYRNQYTPFKESSNFPYVSLSDSETYNMVHLDADGCDEAQYNDIDASGKVVFLHRDDKKVCSFVAKGMIAQGKGAIGVIVDDYMAEAPIIMGGNSTGLNIPMAAIEFESGKEVLAHMKTDMQIKVGRTESTLRSSIIQFVVQRERSFQEYGGKVMIKDVYITGTKYAASECTECQPGYYSLGGVDQPSGCEMCPAGTYAYAGSDECKPCPTGKTSVAGSSTCTSVGKCRKQDYIPSYGPCVTTANGATMNLTWVCTAGEPDSPPADEVIPCGPGQKGDCMRIGYIRNADNTCTQCLDGKVANSDGTQCETCPQDTIPHLVYDLSKGFDALGHRFASDAWSTKCTENCDMTPGWDFSLMDETTENLPQTALTAGKGSTSTLGVELMHTFTAKLEGKVVFTYRVETEEDMGTIGDQVGVYFIINLLKVTGKSDVDGNDVVVRKLFWKSTNLLSVQETTGTLEHKFPPGDYELTWRYQKTPTTKPVVFLLTGLTVYGSSLGTGTSCEQCPEGFYCKDGSVLPCAAGTYRDQSSDPTTCAPCPSGRVSKEGSASCDACPAGTGTVDADHPPVCKLIETCKWVSPKGDAFDFSAIQGATDDALGYVVNLCGKSPSCPSNVYACVNDTSSSVSYGTSVTLEQFDGGVNITLTVGATCPVDPSRELGSVIKVMCDPIKQEEYTAHSKVTQIDANDPCMPIFKIISRSGCPLCTSSAREEYWTSCVNGTQQRIRKYGNCYGAKGYLMETRPCGGGSSKKWLPVVIVISLVAVGGLALFVIRLYRQNTALECKYSHVNTDDDGFHMEDDAVDLPEDDYFTHNQDEDSRETGQVI
eukprot:TRINITY_DN7205_c0_g5_i1.p1 TRINITY_DN7205_c0_g5~~TRINITY_DN7205_c0_g5_i1.p1  ORF type:complete len:1229 (+),score=384.20 TRINITY_DN7205_c0_g5_i1:95-3781(+)